MKLICIGHQREYDLQSIANAFFPGQSFSEGLPLVESKCVYDDGVCCHTTISDGEKTVTKSLSYPDSDNGSIRDAVKKSFYAAAVEYTGITPPWGEFSGIRPIKYMSGMADDINTAKKRFMDELKVSESKAKLCADTLKFRETLDYTFGNKDFSLYVSVPFCPSRCSYCSFISQAGEKMLKLIPPYLEALNREIDSAALLTKENGLSLRSVYVGGGTPAILSPEQLSLLCGRIADAFDTDNLCEFTVELGRPDAITKEKLIAVKAAGVDRISINPQTLNNSVLEAIGRRHTSEQFFEAFEAADKIGFKSINTDLIVGLPNDTPESFQNTMEGILRLSPGNITVHSLCLKKSSWLKVDRETEFLQNKNAISMSDNALELLDENGYKPYYIYKQKNAIGALENTGFCRGGLAGYYNMLMMDDLQTVIGVGAGSASKLKKGDAIKRLYNHKYPYEYTDRPEKYEENHRDIVKFFADVD